MSKIILLDNIISERIAAGEVVERPASIVKELVENSVDAGASALTVSIEDGGLKTIRVTDNGSGIAPEDMPLSICKHATSKIRTIEDLDHICTMGFRGEALSSIAAVSMMTIKSRQKDAEEGTELLVEGGKLVHIIGAGIPEGTTVTVSNLFYNTPARLKFMKKPASEAAVITDLIARLILGNPHVSFRYLTQGKEIFHSPGGGNLLDAIMSVFGASIRNKLAEISYEGEGIKVSGMISVPEYTQKSAKNQFLYVNGRLIKSPQIASFVQRSYGERLLKGSYPFFVINLQMQPDSVDVNVHPTKQNVLFSKPDVVEFAVSHAVERALNKNTATPILRINQQPSAKPYTNRISAQEYLSMQEVESFKSNFSDSRYQRATSSFSLENNAGIRPDQYFARKSEDALRPAAPSPVKSTVPNTFEADFDKISREDTIREQEPDRQITQLAEELKRVTEYKVFGAVFHSYILAEAEDTLYIVDQHALHERILYDKLLSSQQDSVVAQPLLTPVLLQVSHDDQVLLEENSEFLKTMGFEIENFGPLTCKITAVPQIMGSIDAAAIVADLIPALSRKKIDSSETMGLLKQKVAKAACKRAVKAGQPLQNEQLQELLKEIVETGSIPHCPHGRPVAVAITKTELEKNFRRRL